MKGPYLQEIEQLRQVNYARSYLWDVKFVNGPPGPFGSWFPATDMSEPIYSIESMPFDTPVANLSVPKQSNILQLKFTCFDDIDHSLENWMREWTLSIIPERYKYVNYLSDSVKDVIVAKFHPDGSGVKQRSYTVYPEDSLNFEGNSASEALLLPLTFVVAGIRDL